MGISKGWPNGHYIGRIGNIIYYMLNGQYVSRTVGPRKKKATLPQLRSRLKTSMSSKLLKQFKPFFDIGLSIEVLNTNQNPFNMAVSINSRKMMKGIYPDFQIDYSEIELSRGILKKGENLKANATKKAILFTWDAPEKMPWPESSDLVMMIANFPSKKRSIIKIGGDARNTGADQLKLPVSLQGHHAEVYIAFVAADRKQVSDSTYLGSLTSPNP
jgi:hypothetical protein